MLRPQINITIADLVFTYVNNVEITWSRDSFTRTASISLPVRFYKRNKRIFEQVAIGDPVTIRMGYSPTLETRFVGYVTRREPDSPLMLHCEDESWQYKQRFIKPVTLEKTTLEKFINEVYSGKVTQIANGDTAIGDWRVDQNATFLRVLDELRSKFGITAYWDDEKGLNVNAQFNELSAVAGVFDYNKNLITTEGLDFQEAAEFSQIVYGVSEQETVDEKGNPDAPIEVWAFYDATGKIQSATVDPNLQGNVNRFKFPYRTEAELKQLCEQRLENLNFTGFTGNFLTFGEPVVQVNDDCELVNVERPSMSGRYRIKSVTVSYGINKGYKQDIEIARKTA